MRVAVEIAAPQDDEAIRGLLKRQPIRGGVTLTFEREPSFAAGCAVTGDDPLVLVARSEEQEIVGVACRSMRQVFVNGKPERIGYLGQLRIDGRFRGRWLIARGFAQLAKIDRHHVQAYLVSIAEGSDEATAILVNKRRASFPVFHEIARYETLALSVNRRVVAASEVTSASIEDPSEIVDFLNAEGARRQLCEVWSIDKLRALEAFGLRVGDVKIARRNGRIAGVMALWDQSAYKQTVVRDYSGWMKVASWLGGSIVPRVGEKIRSAYGALIAVADDDADLFRRLLSDVSAAAAIRGFDYLTIGLDTRDPLLTVAREHRHVTYRSRLYLASWPTSAEAAVGKPNGACLHESLDRRPVYVDIATL